MPKETTETRMQPEIGLHKTFLEEYFVHRLNDLCGAEQQKIVLLNKWQQLVASAELAAAITEHIAHTEEHIDRIYIVQDMLGEAVAEIFNEVMDGLGRETDRVTSATPGRSATRDVAIVMSLQKAAHYAIASYGTLITLAHTMGRDDVAEILKHNIADEKAMDELLSGLAENGINKEANTESAY